MEDLDYMDNLITLHNQSFQELFVDVHDNDLYIEEPVDNSVIDEEAVDDPDEENVAQNRANEEQEGNADRGEGGRRRVRKMSKVHVTNKLHHLKHYREMAVAFGPPVGLWCAKFEGRMKIFRRHSAICCNFRNPPLTMAKMFQLSSLSAQLGNSEEYLDFQRGNVMTARHSSHKDLLMTVGLNGGDEIIYTNSATFHGEEYRPSLFVCLPGDPSTEENFGLIKNVIVAAKEVLLVIAPWKNEGLSPRLNAYHVIPDNRPLILLRSRSLRHFRCIAPWNPQDSEEIYLSMRTVLV
ncbi:Protein GrpE [Frankliniella fusca]|uniref:Protein GrpE n=1 Tax=Frankliniella fusca TaxID=407009 RepID=A0AAE1HJ13_9NEOP|nr:Protein GrpE [Frankliniella fusca]